MRLILQNCSLECTIFRLIMIAAIIATTTKFNCVSLSSKFPLLSHRLLPVLTQLFTWLPSTFLFHASYAFLILFPFSLSQAFPSLCFAYFSLSEIVFPNLCQLRSCLSCCLPTSHLFCISFSYSLTSHLLLWAQFWNHFFFVETKQLFRVGLWFCYFRTSLILTYKKIVATA